MGTNNYDKEKGKRVYKVFYYLLVIFAFFVFWGCKTTRSIIYDNGSGIADAREHLYELEEQQRENRTEVNGLQSELEGIESKLITTDEQRERDYTEIITELAGRTDDFIEFETILRQIRERNSLLSEFGD